MDHDRLFKELLTTFFVEFIELFLPQVAAYVEPDSVEFLDKEVFTDVTSGDRHEVDVVAKVRFRGKETCFLIHVEAQASPVEDFGRRMFRYFARLMEKHGLPVYPIVLFSYDAPRRPEPDRYQVVFPDKTVLDFCYTVIQLNRLNWRDFVRQANPVASALMAKMDIAAGERAKVKLECLRLLATLKLNRAKMQLIWGFVESYLRLGEDEQREVTRQLMNEEAVMALDAQFLAELPNSFRDAGIVEGRSSLILALLRRRFGEVPDGLRDRIGTLGIKALEDFALALLDFASFDDAARWLNDHP